MAVELVTCRTCGAPNHPARPACGRCRGDLPRWVLEASEPSADAEDAPTGAMAAVSPDGGGDVDDTADAPTAAQPPVGPARGEVDGDATAAVAPVRAATADDATAAVGAAPPMATAAIERGRRAGERVLDLLRGPEPSDTQPLDPTGTTPPPTPSSGRGMPRRSVLLVSVLGLAAGAVVGIAAAQGLFSGDGDTAAPAFDAGVYRRPAERLAVAEVAATSWLPPTGTTAYEPELVLDDDLATAWNSDGAGRPDGVGEEFTIDLADPAWLTAIELANGYQRDDVRFLANARLQRATVTFDGGVRVNVVLLDESGWQRVPLPAPILTTGLTLEVVEVFPGDTYRDLAISGIRLLGHEALGADRELALERAGGPTA